MGCLIFFFFFFSPSAKKETRSLRSGERLSITFDLEPNSCNIYFVPQGGHETVMVYKGELQQLSGCSGIELLNPCGISKDAVQTSCGGRFEVRDHNDDEALVLSVEVQRKKPACFMSFQNKISSQI